MYHTAELNRLCGGASLARQKPRETRGGKSLRVAIEIARAHQAKLLEVRATTPLGRLLLGQSRRAKAPPELADIYKWLTEGVDTGNLKDVKALLDELST